MINKKKLHRLLVKLRPINYWYFLIGFLVFGVLGLQAFRQNNLKMIELREAVFQADEQNGDVETALRQLREHVHAHMNTALTSGDTAIYPPIQLKHHYERLLAAETDRVSQANGNIYTDAQADCERRFPGGFSGSNRLPCIEEYLVSHGGVKAQPVPKELYQFDFVAAKWSFDRAGWSFILCGLFGLLFVLRFTLDLWLRHLLHEHA